MIAVQVDMLAGPNEESSVVIVLDWRKGLAVKVRLRRAII